MILTCPACDTKYVVKDGAIPAGGRQVRCAACKHSWHQDPEMAPPEAAPPETAPPETVVHADIGFPGDLGAPPPPQPDSWEAPTADVPQEAAADDSIAAEPQPSDDGMSAWGRVSEEPVTGGSPGASEPGAATPASDVAPTSYAADVEAPADAYPPSEEFAVYSPIAEDEPVRRRWPLVLVGILLIAAAAAAFWIFAPVGWKERVGLVEARSTQLQLMVTSQDRQLLRSGNELIAVSGRVINPTDKEQDVPPIQAELRDGQSRALVHRWTIAPPARVLAPRSSATFHSAEVDVPKGGDELTITLGG